MKILIVSQYFYPEQFQINEIAPELVKRGHEVTVLTGLPNYPQGEIYPEYRNRQEEYIDGVKVLRAPIHPRKHGSFHLIWNYLSYAINGTNLAKKLTEKYDIILSYQLSPVTSLYPAIAYKRKYKTPILNYCLDIWPESALAHVKSEYSIMYRLITRLSKKLYKQCDHIAVTSRPFIKYLNRKNGIEWAKMSYIPQHADSSYLDMDLTAPNNGIADFMYAGNLGAGQRVDVIIRAASELREEAFIIHIVGDGSARNEIKELAQKLQVDDKIIFYGNQKRESMPSFYRKADALIITLRGDNCVGDTMPGKLQTYMTCGKPIFGAINGAADETIMEAHCGACVNAGDYKGLARLLKDYIQKPSDYEVCGQNAKTYFRSHFTLQHFMDKLENTMKVMTE